MTQSEARIGRRRLIVASGLAAAGLLCPAQTFGGLFGKWAVTTDVIVVGAGAAGLAAAVSAAQHGAQVLLLEKMPDIGGDTLISGGFFGAVDPKRQKAQGIDDSEELFFEQTFRNGDEKADPRLVQVLVKEAGRSLVWLESMGMRFQPTVIEIYGAHWPRCHKPILPAGSGYIQTLSAEAIQKGVDIRTSVKVANLELERDRVVGVAAEIEGKTCFYRARKGVVIATGGFGQNRELVEASDPLLRGLTSTSAPGATGEVMLAAAQAGVVLRDMQYIQCMPGCPAGRRHRVRLHNDVARFILVDEHGNRFVREDERRDVLCRKVLALPRKYAYSIVDSDGLDSYNILVQKEAWQGIETGDAWKADTLEELASKIEVPAEALIASVKTYNQAVDDKNDVLGKSPRELRFKIQTPPFWACYAGMSVHYTMGGLTINEKAQCLNTENQPIAGLWAAGEVTGGVHGANRLGANGLADAVSFGRIAGREAAGQNT